MAQTHHRAWSTRARPRPPACAGQTAAGLLLQGSIAQLSAGLVVCFGARGQPSCRQECGLTTPALTP
eukprot:10347582-Alexandrium_andersonii.AAC.1